MRETAGVGLPTPSTRLQVSGDSLQPRPGWAGLARGMKGSIARLFAGRHAEVMIAQALDVLKRAVVAFGATYFFWRAFAFAPISDDVWSVVRLIDPTGLPLILVGVTALASAAALALAIVSRPLDPRRFAKSMVILGVALDLSGTLVFGLETPAGWFWLAGHLAALITVWWLHRSQGSRAIYMLGMAVLAYAWLGATPDTCQVPGQVQGRVYFEGRYQVVVREGEEFNSYSVPGTCYASESDYTPSVVLEGYRGYNILTLEDRFYGIRQTDGDFDYERFVTGGYNNGVVGDSLEQVKEEIKLLPPDKGTTEPVLVEEGYDGYNLIRYQGRYYAVPQSEGGFDLASVRAGQYSSFFTGSSVEEVMHVIDSSLESSLVQEGYQDYNIIRLGEHRYYGIRQRDGTFSLERFRAGGYPQVVQGNTLEEVEQGIDALPLVGTATP